MLVISQKQFPAEFPGLLTGHLLVARDIPRFPIFNGQIKTAVPGNGQTLPPLL
jgi:hypothetical protein